MGRGKPKYPNKKLIELREKAGLTRHELAQKAFYSEVYISAIERNKTPLTANVAIRLAQIYGISPEEIRPRKEKTE